jgi:hypothetical protein
LLSSEHPFFLPRRSAADRIGVWLTDDPDWEELRAILIESYRVLAPKKRSSLLD